MKEHNESDESLFLELELSTRFILVQLYSIYQSSIHLKQRP